MLDFLKKTNIEAIIVVWRLCAAHKPATGLRARTGARVALVLLTPRNRPEAPFHPARMSATIQTVRAFRRPCRKTAALMNASVEKATIMLDGWLR